jgi:hypothetical protein
MLAAARALAGSAKLAAAAGFAAALTTAAAHAATDAPQASTRVPLPSFETPAGDRCVEDTQFMRRNHMEVLKHHRDRTVHEGIRTTQHSLANCVTCHASPKTGRVTGTGGFCSSCHSYAAVKLDCFECHADRPKAALAEAKPGAETAR